MLPGVGLQRRPLRVEEVLDVEVEAHVLGELLPPGCHRLWGVVPEGLVRPVQPAFPAETVLGRHVEGVVLHPGAAGAEGGHPLLIPDPAPAEGQAQEPFPAGQHGAVVDGGVTGDTGTLHLRRRQEAVFLQKR